MPCRWLARHRRARDAAAAGPALIGAAGVLNRDASWRSHHISVRIAHNRAITYLARRRLPIVEADEELDVPLTLEVARSARPASSAG